MDILRQPFCNRNAAWGTSFPDILTPRPSALKLPAMGSNPRYPRYHGPRINWGGMFTPAIRNIMIACTGVLLLQTLLKLLFRHRRDDLVSKRIRLGSAGGHAFVPSLAAGDLLVPARGHLASFFQHAVPVFLRRGPGTRLGHASILRLLFSDRHRGGLDQRPGEDRARSARHGNFGGHPHDRRVRRDLRRLDRRGNHVSRPAGLAVSVSDQHPHEASGGGDRL